MSGEFLIRDLERRDFAEWKALWDGYNEFYGRKGQTALPEIITNATWARFFDGYEPIHALVAEGSGKLLGLVHFLFHRSSIVLTSNCYLQDLFAADDARRRGVGRSLIEEVYRRAERAGCARVYWQTEETNATARKLYDKVAEKSGFIVYRKDLRCVTGAQLLIDGTEAKGVAGVMGPRLIG
ncbi:MAG: GNAT family N-acetyltransferase [Candidatus Acidiferrales bacterium]